MVSDSVSAKIGALKSTLLSPKDYAALSEAHSVEEVLKSSAIGKIGLGDWSKSYHSFEFDIFCQKQEEYNRIISFIPDRNVKRFLKDLLLNRKMVLIKRILTGFETGKDFKAEYALLFADRKTGEEVYYPQNTAEFIESLTDANIHDAFYEENKKVDIGAVLRNFDLLYYLNVWKSIKRHLDTVNQKAMSIIMGTEIDIKNIMWIYRMKILYNMQPQDIYANIVPINYRIDKDKVRQLVESSGEKDFFRIIEGSFYCFAVSQDEPIESAYYKAMHKAFRSSKQYKSYVRDIAEFIYLGNRDSQDLLTLLECIRYELSSDEILDRMSFFKRKGGKKIG